MDNQEDNYDPNVVPAGFIGFLIGLFLGTGLSFLVGIIHRLLT